MLDPDQRLISLEEALDLCGRTKPVAHQYGREFLRKHVDEGSTRRIQGRGLT